MSSDARADSTVFSRIEPPDFSGPIARSGEQQFACILRNRSGFDAGNIDFGLRDLSSLVDAEQQDACDTAYALYRAICDQTGNIAAAEVAGIGRALAAETGRGRVVALIAAERSRQVDGEGFSTRRDDDYTAGELALAASCYAAGHRVGWPWGPDWWKPTPHDRTRDLVKAGALIVAEIERLQRAQTPEASHG